MDMQRVEVGRPPLPHYTADVIRAELQALQAEKSESRDHKFFLELLQRRGGLALELGSGIGQRLLSYLLSGIHVHGVEASSELFAVCQAQAQKLGIVPTIHRQIFDRLDIPMSFKTIYAPLGVFQSIESLDAAEIVLQRFFEHLELNGTLIAVLEAPTLHRLAQPQNIWQKILDIERHHDRARIIQSQAISRNILEQKNSITDRYDIFYLGGATESYVLERAMRWYHKFEFKMMLERAGFAEVIFHGNYNNEPATDADENWVVYATKKS